MYQLAQESGVNIVPFTTHTKFDADVIVDALMGIGTEGIVQGDIRCAIDKISSTQKPVLSIDIPSGLNANTGEPCGIAVKANFTITFIRPPAKRFIKHDGLSDSCGILKSCL